MNRRVFISGAAGFIGYHLALKLTDLGDVVCGYDNFNDYYSPHLKRCRAAELAKRKIALVEGDICCEELLIKSANAFSPTHCVHLAAQAGVRYSLEQPRAYLKTNVEGFLNILELCRLYPEIKLIYASSSSVYGSNRKIPFAVGDPTDNQASLYGVTKKSNELMATCYHNLFGISAIGLRFFTVYGPWGRPDMAYYRFAEAIDKGEPIDLYNRGNVERDFTYIDDIVAGIIATLDLKPQCSLFNLGNNRPQPVLALVKLLEQHLEKKAITRKRPMQLGDVKTTCADISSSSEFLQFEPTVSLDEGIARFINWYRNFTPDYNSNQWKG